MVLECLDRAYLRPKTFLHDLMKPIRRTKEVLDMDFQALVEYRDLLIRIFDIADDACLLPIIQRKNPKVMYKKWLHNGQTW